jgi:predicted transcriptional regulator
MSALRTQIYLSPEQRRRVDEVAALEDVSLAEVIRRALDAYLETQDVDSAARLSATFGADPDVSYPDRDEWDRG